MRKLIFHIDVNSAYLSWEAARRVANGEPDLRLIPSAIGGDPEKRTGVILAKSIPAKGGLCPDLPVRHGGREENQIEEAGQNRGRPALQIRPRHHPARRPLAGDARSWNEV